MRISRSNFICVFFAGVMCLLLTACDGGSKSSSNHEDEPKLNIGLRTMTGQGADPTQTAAAAQPSAAAPDNDAADAGDLENFEIGEENLYSGIGKTDPFSPLVRADMTVLNPDAEGDGSRRVPQTPLERLDLGQLKLSAVVVSSSRGNSAVVIENSGRGYVVKVGTYIGLNGGQITDVKSDRIIIEEPLGKNERGEVKVNTIELILPKPAGAF